MIALFGGLAIAALIAGWVIALRLWYQSRQAQLWRRGIREEENEEPPETIDASLKRANREMGDLMMILEETERLLRIGLEPDFNSGGSGSATHREMIQCWLCKGTGIYVRSSAYPQHAWTGPCDGCEGTGLVPKPIDPGYTARDAFPEK